MLTLFHHSLPPWAGEYGGWKSEKTVNYFMDFTRFDFQTLPSYSIIFFVIFGDFKTFGEHMNNLVI